ncbi:MAG: proprotein convertase P-domain-containing protein [Desulfobacteraceae bacterium]
MSENAEKPIGAYLWRSDKKIAITKVPDRFTVRLKRGVGPTALTRRFQVDHHRSMARQNLEEFAVDAAETNSTMERVRREEDVAFAAHVYSFEGDPRSRFYLTDEITIQFEDRASDAQIETMTAGLGLSLVKAVAGMPRTFVFRVTSQAVENPIKIANRLMDDAKVVVSEPNIAIAVKQCYQPEDPLFSSQWHLFNQNGPSISSEAHVDAARAWDITRGERSIVVAVADDSVDIHHTDLQGNGKIVSPRDFGGRDDDPSPESAYDNHGTACAGVAVAEENGSGVVGAAPGCALMPIRTSGIIDDNAIEELMDWIVTHGADVLSCSWHADAVYFGLTWRMRQAMHRAATQGRNGKGCVLVFAAGNANRPINGTVDERSWPDNVLSGPTRWLNGFAAHDDVIAVAASTSQAKKSAYSNWGAEISVCAPSNNAPPGTYPMVTAYLPGRGILTTDRMGPSGYDSSDYTYDFGGTSSACPLVAGVAALVLSAYPDLTAGEVKEILQTTADKIEDHDADPQLEQGLGTYDESGHSQWFGYGKVNAFNAVTEAVRRKPNGELKTFQMASYPEMEIPDADNQGVADTISFDEEAVAVSIQVHMHITHTYIGDLRLTLTAPSGHSVVLHDRNGAGANDIQATYDAHTTPGLSNLAGQSIQGDWTLQVQDLATGDEGRLNRWELEIRGRSEALVALEESPAVRIPDKDPEGIQRTLEAPAAGSVEEINVSIDITHTWIGDLKVALVSPSNSQVLLHSRTGGSADNLITTYTPATTAGLQTLRGEAISGPWRLRVADLEGQDVGKLNRWALHIIRQP